MPYSSSTNLRAAPVVKKFYAKKTARLVDAPLRLQIDKPKY
jgi:hypothetical protein